MLARIVVVCLVLLLSGCGTLDLRDNHRISEVSKDAILLTEQQDGFDIPLLSKDKVKYSRNGDYAWYYVFDSERAFKLSPLEKLCKKHKYSWISAGNYKLYSNGVWGTCAESDNVIFGVHAKITNTNNSVYYDTRLYTPIDGKESLFLQKRHKILKKDLAYKLRQEELLKKEIRTDHLHLKYLDEFRDPMANLLTHLPYYRPLFELNGPVKSVTLFKDKEKTKYESDARSVSLPWNQPYLEFNTDGNLISVQRPGWYHGEEFWSNAKYDYEEGRLTRYTDYGPKKEVLKYIDYTYNRNGFIDKKKHYNRDNGNLALYQIEAYNYSSNHNGCYDFTRKDYKVQDDSTYEWSLTPPVCKKVSFVGYPNKRPALKRWLYNIEYAGEDHQRLIMEYSGVRYITYVDDKGHVSAERIYRNIKNFEPGNYTQYNFTNVQTDSHGNWIERKQVYIKKAFGEIVDREESSMYRTIEYF